MTVFRKGDEFVRVELVPKGVKVPKGKRRDDCRLVTKADGKKTVMTYRELLDAGWTVWSVS